MDKKIISEKNYIDTLECVINSIRGRKAQLGTRHILFVPDKYTLYAERLLYKDTAGAFDAEVLTFNRLFYRLCNTAEGYLNKQGAVMLMRKVITALTPKLKCFGRSSKFKGFALKMYETICQLASCRIMPADLPVTTGSFNLRLSDIKTIYEGYLTETDGKYIDANGRHELLIAALKSQNHFADAHVYFANFDGHTNQTRTITNLICKGAISATIGEPTFDITQKCAAEIYYSGELVSELKATAKRIRNHVFEGLRYEEMCVIADTTQYETIKRIFKEFEIPFYIDKKYKLSTHPLSRFIITATAAGKRLSREHFVALSKNPFACASKADADEFENYCNKYAVDYVAFSAPFTKLDDSLPNEHLRLTAAERVRERLYNLCCEIATQFDSCTTAHQFLEFIKGITLSSSTAEIVAHLNSIGTDWGDASARINSLAAMLENIFAKQESSAEQIMEAFESGLDATEVALIPPLSDTVVIGEPATFRGNRFKQVFILNFSEGQFPPILADTGIISDRDAVKLQNAGVMFEPLTTEINERAYAEAVSIMCNQHLTVFCPSGLNDVYCTAGGGTISFTPTAKDKRPSPLITHIENYDNALFANWQQRENINMNGGDFTVMARHASCNSNALEMLILSMNEQAEIKYTSELYYAIKPNLKRFFPQQASDIIACASDIFFKSGSTSISKIQEYFACPFKHFLHYGLKLNQRHDGTLSRLDIGNFLHKIIEHFVRNNQFDDVAVAAKILVEQIIHNNQKYLYRANEGVIRQMTTEAIKICQIVAHQINSGSYKSIGQEERFPGGEICKNTLKFTAHGREIFLNGCIDRIDALDNYARVIDYKTGQANFDFSALYYGKKIQLMLYLRIMRENGFLPAGMFYFPFSTRWRDNAFSHRLIGLYNSQPQLWQGMDGNLKNEKYSSQVISAITNKGYDKSGYSKLSGKCKNAYSTNDLNAMGDYAFKVLQVGANEIVQGYIAKSPSVMDKRAECSWCEMRAACMYDFKGNGCRELETVQPTHILTAAAED